MGVPPMPLEMHGRDAHATEMTVSATNELWAVFDARRVKAPELRGLDSFVNSGVGWFKNRRRAKSRLRRQAEEIEKLEPEIHNLSSSRFQEEVVAARDAARLKKLEGELFNR